METIRLDDGRVVELGEATRGGSKNRTRFGRVGTERVVVKVEQAHGRLADEERALRFLAGRPVRVPAVLASGLTDAGRRFLVISREAGACPVTPEGWGRFGRDLAALADVPTTECPLPHLTARAFVAEQRRRLTVVRGLLSDALAEAIAAAIDEIGGGGRPVVTHGDAGSGNYLDQPDGSGVLLDWETTMVAPHGIDLARGAFIGLLDLWGTGIAERLVAAFLDGYAGGSPADDRLSDRRVEAWITIGGLQFIHDRHVTPLRSERTAEVAVRTLAAHLRS